MFKPIYTAVISAIVTSLITHTFLNLLSTKQQIATVDVLSITSSFIKGEAQKNHTTQQKEVAIKAFSHDLEGALQRLATSKKLVLLPREAVIKGSPDYTNTLMSMMKGEHKS
jgi:hypothetical protein